MGIVVGMVSQEVFYIKIPVIDFPKPKKAFENFENSNYNFVLLNESGASILMGLQNGYTTVVSCKYILPPQNNTIHGIIAMLDTGLPTVLTIQTQNQEVHLSTYVFALGKTMYITWTDKKTLVPQVGKLYGLIPVSRAGFMLKKNVQLGDINEV